MTTAQEEPFASLDDSPNPFAELGDEEPEGRDLPVKRGRYAATHPVTGKPGTFMRATNLAKTLADTYHLDRWQLRVVAKGMAIRPDLCELAHGMDVTDDKEDLQKIADQAREAAGANKGANMGTALHKHCERLDAGESIDALKLSAGSRRDVEAYRDFLTEKRIEILPYYCERPVFNTETNTIGRIDKIGWDRELWPLPRIVDLKTQKTMDFGGLEISVQLAQYGYAQWMWIREEDRWVPMPELDKETATVIHLPVGKASPEDYEVPIDRGWRYAMLSLQTKTAQREGRGLIKRVPDDREYRVRFRKATTREEFSAIYRDAFTAGKWSKELERYSVGIFQTLPNV